MWDGVWVWVWRWYADGVQMWNKDKYKQCGRLVYTESSMGELGRNARVWA